MSDASGGVIVPPLNDQQATAILQEALNRGMMQGAIPGDEPTRLAYAQQLVSQAKLAADNGNQNENVMAVLFIAEVDQSPPPVQPVAPPAVPAAPAAAPPMAAPPVAAPAAAPPMAPPPGAPPAPAPQPQPAAQGSFDVTTIGDDSLAKMIQTLEAPEYAGKPNVEQELAQLRAERERRAGGQAVAQAPVPQAVAPPAQAPPAAAPPTPSPAMPTAPAPAPGAFQPGQPPQPEPAAAPPQGPVGFPPGGPPATDAAGNPVAAAPQPGAEGVVPQAEPTQEDGERAALEAQITLAHLRAHNISQDQVPGLTIDQLRFVVANPGGPVADSTTATAPTPGEAPNSEREQLLAQITGPILKAWGQGRASLAGIGDHELMLMIEHPDAAVTYDQIMVVRGADGTQETITQLPKAVREALEAAQAPAASPAQPPAPAPVAAAPPQPQPVAAPPQMQPPAPSAFAPPAEAPAQAPAPAPTPVATPPAPAATAPPVPASIAPPAGAPAVPVASATDRAMQIIQQENMPIPPEIDGDPPRLPNDISATSDAELRSYHARFHACEVRMNWVISGFDDEIGDVKKLLRDRRREVALTVKGEDGKRLTKDAKEALVEADEHVQGYLHQLEEIEKTVGKLKVLRDGYHQDVSTCSRQWSMRYGEQERMPR